MTLSGIPWWWAALLAAGCAALLAALHLLRVRLRETPVITTLFWAEALEPAAARSVLQRFRHPWTYLLLLAFCLLVCLALLQPIWFPSSVEQRWEVIVLDGGASLAGPADSGETRFAAGRRLVLAEAESLRTSDRLTVVVADPWPRVVHAFADPSVVLRDRLSRLQPGSSAGALAPALRLARALLDGPADGRIVVVTDRPLDPAVAQGAGDLPLQTHLVGVAAENAALLSVMFEPLPDDPFRGDLKIRVGYWGPKARAITLQVRRGGGALLHDAERTVAPDSTADFIIPNLRADGDRLVVDLLPPDDLAADDSARFRLPARARIRLGVSGTVPRALQLALDSDPAIQQVGPSEERGVELILDGRKALPDRPALVIPATGAAAPEGSALHVAAHAWLVRNLDLGSAVCGAGASLSGLADDAAPLIMAGESLLAASSEQDGMRRVFLAPALLNGDFTRHPAFVIFLSRSVRWLDGWPEDPTVLPLERTVRDPLWALRTGDPGAQFAMPGSRLAGDLSFAPPQPPELPGAARWGPPAPFEIVLAVATILFVVQAMLHARGRIP